MEHNHDHEHMNHMESMDHSNHAGHGKCLSHHNFRRFCL